MQQTSELIKIIEENDLQEFLFTEEIDDVYEQFLEIAEMEEDGSIDGELLVETVLDKIGFPKKYSQVDYVCNSDEMYCVIHFTEEDIYLKLTGEYDSYGQCEHDYDCGIKEVKPKQKLITVYE